VLLKYAAIYGYLCGLRGYPAKITSKTILTLWNYVEWKAAKMVPLTTCIINRPETDYETSALWIPVKCKEE
jgi:hypothetical protein